MKRALIVATVALLVLPILGTSLRADDPPAEAAPEPPKAVDLVICLDTSGSMEGLIHAARQKLWSVVSELATAKPTPDLRLALLTYGSPGHDDTGHVVLQADLTRDLDLVSERLFALETRGGEELVGRVVHHALANLSWTEGDAVRILFVAGNESADQDREKPFREQAEAAAARGIAVNAVYCGGADDGDAVGYRELAAIGNGRFASIDHDHGTVAVATPFDEELARLSREINRTYVGYGEVAEAARERQVAQDANAASAGAPAAAQRAAAKAGRLYRNASWDLVDRMDEEGFDLSQIPEEALPEELREIEPTARLAWLERKKAEREAIRDRIRELAEAREAFVREEMAKRKLDDSKSLDRALEDAIREQVAHGGFEFDNP